MIFDTNTLISAAINPTSTPGLALSIAQHPAACLELFFSTETWAELLGVIIRSKFDRYITIEQRSEFLRKLENLATFVETFEPVIDCRDPQDNKFLELALAVGSNAIVTGDRDLLTLNPWRNIQIVSPAEFLQSYSI